MAANLALFLTLFIVLNSCSQFAEAVTFNFSVATLDISEGAALNRTLFINKTGINTMRDISFQVTVMQGTATPTRDYIPNDDHIYTFNSGTMSLPVETRLVTDRAGEGIEHFRICLPGQSVLEPMGAEAVYPTCVNITIIDDDSVVIGFKDGSTSVDITEGGPPQMICAEVKSFGLELDPFDSVPLDLRTVSGNGVMLGTGTFTFTAANTVSCTTVSVADNDLVEGTRTSQVMLVEQSPPTTTVPTELYPGSAVLTIADNDVIRFRFEAQPSYTLLEGETLNDIRIIKYGSETSLTFTVSPTVVPLNRITSSRDDITVTRPQFSPSDNQRNVVVQAPNDDNSEGRKEFDISITNSNIQPENNSGVRISVEGEPIRIVVYDNDFNIGFNEGNIIEINPSFNVCVAILKPQEDIHPNTRIPLNVTIDDSTSILSGSQVFEQTEGILNATNTTTCFYANFSSIASTCGVSITARIFWTCDQSCDLTSNCCQNTTTLTTYDCGSNNSGSIAAAVTIPILAIIVAGILCVFIGLYFSRKLSCGDSNSQESGKYAKGKTAPGSTQRKESHIELLKNTDTNRSRTLPETNYYGSETSAEKPTGNEHSCKADSKNDTKLGPFDKIGTNLEVTKQEEAGFSNVADSQGMSVDLEQDLSKGEEADLQEKSVDINKSDSDLSEGEQEESENTQDEESTDEAPQ